MQMLNISSSKIPIKLFLRFSRHFVKVPILFYCGFIAFLGSLKQPGPEVLHSCRFLGKQNIFGNKYLIVEKDGQKRGRGEWLFFLTYNELSQKTGFNLYQLRHCAYITYSVKNCFFLNLSVYELTKFIY